MKRLAVVIMVLLVGVAAPASAQIVIPPPPVIGPISPPVIGVPVVPDLPPSWGDSPSIGERLCAGGLGWLGSAFGWCTKDGNDEYQLEPPSGEFGNDFEESGFVLTGVDAYLDYAVNDKGGTLILGEAYSAADGGIVFGTGVDGEQYDIVFQIPEGAGANTVHTVVSYANSYGGRNYVFYRAGVIYVIGFNPSGTVREERHVSVGSNTPGRWVHFLLQGRGSRGGVQYVNTARSYAFMGGFGGPLVLGGQDLTLLEYFGGQEWEPGKAPLVGPIVKTYSYDQELCQGTDYCLQAQSRVELIDVEVVGGKVFLDEGLTKEEQKRAWREWLDNVPEREPEVELEPEPEYVQEDEFPSEDPQGQTDSDWILGNRIAGFFDSLLGGIWDAITWLGNLLKSLFQWLIDELWAIARWFYAALSSLIDLVITAVGAVVAAIVALGNMLHGLITIVIQLLGQMLTYLIGIAGAVITAIPAILMQLLAVLEAIATWLFSLPELIFGLFWDVMIYLFVPQNPTVGSINWPPVITGWPGIFGGVPDAIGTAINSSCGPSLDLQVGDFDQHLTFVAPTPSGVCGGNGPGGSVTAMDLKAGDLYGYRSALRALISFGLVVAFVRVNLRALGIGKEAVEAIPVGPV